MPMRGDLPTSKVQAHPRPTVAQAVWLYVVSVISNHDLQCVIAFCTIGFLIALNVILRVPDFGATAATLQAFP